MYMHKKDKIYMNYANNEDTSRKEAYYDGTIIKNRELSHHVKRDLLHMYIVLKVHSYIPVTVSVVGAYYLGPRVLRFQSASTSLFGLM